jgi:hypothetical protein
MNNFIGRKPISPKQKNMPNLVHICEGPFIHTQSQPFQHSENKGLGSCNPGGDRHLLRDEGRVEDY